MNIIKKVVFEKTLFPLWVGLLIFGGAQILGSGFEVFLWFFADLRIGLELPVPWHIQTLASLLAILLTIVCFRKIFKGKYQRIVLVLTLLVCFLVLIPLGWLYFTSHGNLELMADRLLDFPEVFREANTWVTEESILQISTAYGPYTYRFYWDRKKSEYVYEIGKEEKVLFSQRIYHFKSLCIQSETQQCKLVTLPYTLVDLSTVEVDYKQSIITSAGQLKDIDGDGVIDLTVHEFSGYGDLSQYRIFSLGSELKSTVRPAPDPK